MNPKNLICDQISKFDEYCCHRHKYRELAKRLNLLGEKNFLLPLPTHRQSEVLCRHLVYKSANSYHHQGDIYLQIDLPQKISV